MIGKGKLTKQTNLAAKGRVALEVCNLCQASKTDDVLLKEVIQRTQTHSKGTKLNYLNLDLCEIFSRRALNSILFSIDALPQGQ